MRSSRFRRLVHVVVPVVAGLLAAGAALRLCRGALELTSARLLAGDPAAARELARGAASWGERGDADFDTGSQLFDREWAFGAPAMRAACLAQVILRDPDAEPELGAALDRAAAEVLAPKSRAFSEQRWGSDPIDGLDEAHDHAAYLGYAGVAIGLASWVHPAWSGPRTELARRLRARVARAGEGWPETYPGEAYPPDVAMGVAALALDERGAPPSVARTTLIARLRSAIDPGSGLLLQSVDPATGERVDGPRGSGTFLGVYALSFAEPELAAKLYARGRDLRATRLGFLGMREHPDGEGSASDVDSGPVLLDLGVSATGFALAGARAFGDETTYLGLDATARLFAVPLGRDDDAEVSLAGGPLGDAILCAMRTAPTPAEVARWRARTSVAPVKGGA